MKRYLAIFLCVLCLYGFLCLSVSAEQAECRLSEDLKTLYCDGEYYSRVNLLSMDYYLDYQDLELALSASQQAQFSDATVYLDEHQALAEVTLIGTDGTRTIIGYLKDSLQQEYEYLLGDTTGEFVISHYYNDVTADWGALKGTPVTLDSLTALWGESYPIVRYSNDGDMCVIRGTLLIDGSRYYYIDYAENGIIDRCGYLTQDLEGASAYLITDTELCAAIKELQTMEYGFDIIDDDGSNVLTAIMLSLIFGVLPCGVLILSLILCFRSKGFYRTAWGITAGICGVELVLFAVLMCLLLFA